MPKVSTQKANKDYPSAGIKKGETYYSWSFRYGGARKSKTYPRPSQLTLSKMSDAYAASESVEDALKGEFTPDDIVSALNEAAEQLRAVAQEYQDGLDNMPTQEGPIGEGMQEKIDGLEDWATQMDDAASEIEGLSAEDYSADQKDKFEDLSDDEKKEMCAAVEEMASGVTDCPF